MTTFAEDIEEAANGQSIEAIVIGPFGWSDDMDDDERPEATKRGVVLTWAEARPMLDYSYDSGCGAAGCDAIWAWTPTEVLFVHEYDGATGLRGVPRNPVDGKPGMS